MLAIIGFSLLMFTVVGGFSVFHFFLILLGKTTKVQIKGRKEGGTASTRTVCCGRPPSRLRLRDLASETNTGGEHIIQWTTAPSTSEAAPVHAPLLADGSGGDDDDTGAGVFARRVTQA
jgi:hypothetical protein